MREVHIDKIDFLEKTPIIHCNFQFGMAIFNFQFGHAIQKCGER